MCDIHAYRTRTSAFVFGCSLQHTALFVLTPSSIHCAEISSVGLSAEAAEASGLQPCTREGGSLVVGYAYFKDTARGRLTGDLDGFLKIVAKAEGPTRHVIIGVSHSL
jgi:pyruvate/2-oxoglutarate dehydrogenase complex dihydrolipoamide dehydrogenase (E3) component